MPVRLFLRAIGWVLSGFIFFSCGNNSPTSPGQSTLPIDPERQYIDGITDRNVVGANASGVGSNIDIEAPGYYKRQTILSEGPIYRLYPSLDENYDHRVVYHSTRWNFGLVRPQDGVYSVSLPPEIIENVVWRAHAERALAEARRATGDSIRFDIVASGSAQIEVVVDPYDKNLYNADGTLRALALNYPQISNFVMTGSRIVFHSLDGLIPGYLGNVLLHEVGHFLGFGHSPDPSDIMSEQPADRFSMLFSKRLTDTWRLMHHRRPGNRFPDTDPARTDAFANKSPRGIVRPWICR